MTLDSSTSHSIAEETENVSEGRTSTGRDGDVTSGCENFIRTPDAGEGKETEAPEEAEEGKETKTTEEAIEAETSMGSPESNTGRSPGRADSGKPRGATTWSYVIMHNMKVAAFEERVNSDAKFKCFIHRSWQKVKTGNTEGTEKVPCFPNNSLRIEYLNNGLGGEYRDKSSKFHNRLLFQRPRNTVKKELKPTVSGLVFLQGRPKELQNYLNENFYPCYLIKDCSTGKAAVISDSQMQPFMKIASAHPERVRFLRKPFAKFAEDHTLLRVLTGPFKGQEGYIVRIDRDRQLVMDFGGIAVAFSGIRNEDVEPVK